MLLQGYGPDRLLACVPAPLALSRRGTIFLPAPHITYATMNPLRELRSTAALTLLAAALPAQVELHTKAAGKVVSAQAAIQRLTTGLKATCGPVWIEQDQALIFADPGSGRQRCC